jgi:hypothetical protein
MHEPNTKYVRWLPNCHDFLQKKNFINFRKKDFVKEIEMLFYLKVCIVYFLIS